MPDNQPDLVDIILTMQKKIEELENEIAILKGYHGKGVSDQMVAEITEAVSSNLAKRIRIRGAIR